MTYQDKVNFQLKRVSGMMKLTFEERQVKTLKSVLKDMEEAMQPFGIQAQKIIDALKDVPLEHVHEGKTLGEWKMVLYALRRAKEAQDV